MQVLGDVLTCKAAVAYGPGQPLKIETVQVAPPKSNEVRIKIDYTALCHTDFVFWKGQGLNGRFPRIFGHEAAGTVESVGEGVTSLKVGDAVLPVFTGECGECPHCKHPKSNMCDLLRIDIDRTGMLSDKKSRFSVNGKPINHFLGTSTFSQYTVCHVGCLAKINPKAPRNKVCILSCGVSTGMGAMVNCAKPTKGSVVAVFGLGGVGLAAAEGARLNGAARIIGIDVNSGKFEKGLLQGNIDVFNELKNMLCLTAAKEFGCTEFLNPRDYDRPIEEVIKEMTNGGVDAAVECTGIVQAMMQAFNCVHDGWGVAVLVGVPRENDIIQAAPTAFLDERTLTGTFFGNYKPLKDLPGLVDLFMNKKLELEKFITHRTTLSNINYAFELMKKGEGIRCVIDMNA